MAELMKFIWSSRPWYVTWCSWSPWMVTLCAFLTSTSLSRLDMTGSWLGLAPAGAIQDTSALSPRWENECFSCASKSRNNKPRSLCQSFENIEHFGTVSLLHILLPLTWTQTNSPCWSRTAMLLTTRYLRSPAASHWPTGAWPSGCWNITFILPPSRLTLATLPQFSSEFLSELVRMVLVALELEQKLATS